MTDVIEQGSEIRGNVIGARLRAAREFLQLSEKEAAARLHLNPKIITLLEKEDLENAPPATFLRGYFKSYAKLVNVSEQEVNQALDRLGINVQPAAALSSIFLETEELQDKSNRYIHWITYLVVTVLIVLVGIWWHKHSGSVSQILNPVLTPTLHTETTKSNPVIQPIIVKESIENATSKSDLSTLPPEPAVSNAPPTKTEATVPSPTELPKENQTHSVTHTKSNLSDMSMQLPEPGLESNDTHSSLQDDDYTN